MLHLAILGGGFLENAGELDPLSYFFGAGIATNIGAALVCVAIGWLWSKTKYWPLHALHLRHEAHTAHLERLGQSLIEVHEKLDRMDPPRP